MSNTEPSPFELADEEDEFDGCGEAGEEPPDA